MPATPRFWRDTWSLVKPYWKSEEKFSAWLLLGTVIALTLAMVYMSVLFNEWYNAFYNALQEKNIEESREYRYYFPQSVVKPTQSAPKHLS